MCSFETYRLQTRLFVQIVELRGARNLLPSRFMVGPHRTTFKTPTQVAVGTELRLPRDWDLLLIAPVNVLLIGDSLTTSACVDAMRPHLVEPLVHTNCRDGSVLSSVPSRGTVMFSDLDELVLADQQRLNDWLAHDDHRPRVISTSRASLFPMIEAGMFIESLYYRLNTLCLDLTNSPVER